MNDTFQPPDPDAWKGEGTDPRFNDLMHRMAEMAERHEKEKAARKKEKAARKAAGYDFNCFIKPTAAWSWSRDGIERWLCIHPKTRSWCGYVRFPVIPMKAEGYMGLLKYVPVHGGITWAEDSPDGSYVYGFDCGHASDHESGAYARKNFDARMKKFQRTRQPKDLMPPLKRRTFRWLRANVEIMALGIQVAARYEAEYAAAQGNEAKSKVIEHFLGYLAKEADGKLDVLDNFGVMINLLCGEL